MPTENPKNLILLAKQGDKKAFDSLYELYLTPVYRYILLRVSDKELAEDLSQAVFLKAYKALDNYTSREKPPLAYFFTIARNTVIDHFRKNSSEQTRSPEELDLQIPDHRPGPELEFIKTETSGYIRNIITRLAPQQQEVIILKFISGLTYTEIAQQLGKNETAIRQLQSRALTTLRQIINNNIAKHL